jgi:uncharacterized protein (TIGR00255 family)
VDEEHAMIRSMTGFGSAERSTAAGRLQVEIRTVNHRYLNVNVRIPTALARLEPELREWLRVLFNRGHVNCTVRLEPNGDVAAMGGLRIDEERVAAYIAGFRAIGERFGVPGTPDLALLSRFNDLFVRGGADTDDPLVEPDELRTAVDEAAKQATRMREDEGRRLSDDLVERIDTIGQALDVIAERAPERLLSERDRLRAAVLELAGGVAVDEMRLAQEIAYLAERLDINEELVRFRSHLQLFREMLGAPADEAVGKRLGFLVQEMHREANTIGSKANDAVIAHRVIAVKEEVERLREQVENVE